MGAGFLHGRRRLGGWYRCFTVVVVAVFVTAFTPLEPAAAAFVGTGVHPWAIVLCNFSNQRWDPAPASYYNNEYGDAGANAGNDNLEDFWHDVSWGRLSIVGTHVIDGPHADANGWYTVNETRDSWGLGSADRGARIRDCENAAVEDTDYKQFWGVVTVFPEASSNITTALTASASDTTVTVLDGTTATRGATTTNYWQTAPFLLSVDKELVRVTGETTHADGSETFTVTRGVNGTTVAAHARAAIAGAPGDLGAWGTGEIPVPLDNGNTYQLGQVVMPNQGNLTIIAHETGHGFGYEHSRAISLSTTDYNDATDNMSAYSDTFQTTTLGTPYGGSTLSSSVGVKGPGLTSSNLDSQGWIPTAKHDLFPAGHSAAQQTITLRALSDPFALSDSGFVEARIPAAVPIENASPTQEGDGTPPRLPTVPVTCSPRPYACTTSQYYTVDYREKANWDAGFPEDAIVLHLVGGDGRTYWVDRTPRGNLVGDFDAGQNGLLVTGQDYGDDLYGAYIAVNALNGNQATVTISHQPLAPNLSVPVAHGTIRYGQQFQLRSMLTVDGAPVPRQPVTITFGDGFSAQSCVGITDVDGLVTCTVRDDRNPGPAPVRAQFFGDSAYHGVAVTGHVTIPRQLPRVALSVDATHLLAIVHRRAKGEPIPTGIVRFLLAGKRIASKKLPKSGKISVPYTRPQHRVTVVLKYSGDHFYTATKATGHT